MKDGEVGERDEREEGGKRMLARSSEMKFSVAPVSTRKSTCRSRHRPRRNHNPPKSRAIEAEEEEGKEKDEGKGK
jgi:hypothetical protein